MELSSRPRDFGSLFVSSILSRLTLGHSKLLTIPSGTLATQIMSSRVKAGLSLLFSRKPINYPCLTLAGASPS